GLRPAGLHSALGPLAPGPLGGEAQDVQEPIPPGIDGHRGLVPKESTRRAGPPARDPESEASRSLRVLRDHGQRGCAEPVPAGSDRALEEMAWPSPSERRSLLGADGSPAGAGPAPAAGRRPLCVAWAGAGL